MPKRKGGTKKCIRKKVAVVMHERKHKKGETRKQKIAIALSVAREHCGAAPRKK